MLIEELLNLRLSTVLVNIRKSAAGINNHVVSGVLNGLICANPERFGKYFKVFKVTRSWVRSLYRRINFSRRAVTTSRPIITRSLWEEINTQYGNAVRTYNIPDESMLNAQTKHYPSMCTHN